jgi:hypothetical protein
MTNWLVGGPQNRAHAQLPPTQIDWTGRLLKGAFRVASETETSDDQ